ncbi:MAG: hypothetical protein BGO21_26405 [Dyadobacter sp. 50-39]|nr:MAG: hypothetical protein BGO21_26405 [Dyadobacter sp. 50-39]
MKRTIRFIYMTLALALSIQGLQAQSVSGGSRLNMVGKKKAPASQNIKFSNFSSGVSYKPLTLQNPKALNRFYTSFLFASANPSDNNSLVVEVAEKGSEKKTPAMEAQLRAEELLFVSDKISVSNVYPNPASEYAEIDFTINPGLRDARLTFYNVLGSQMQEFTLNKNERKLRINTRDMATGLYFYQLSVDGKKVATKKMLVRHQQ